MPDPLKRELRQQKREVKKAGVRHVRRALKRDLAENPDEAPFSEAGFGRLSSAPLNGIDRDATRRRAETPEEDEPDA